jgi:hypothetical protein
MKKTILLSSMAMALAGCGGDSVILPEQNPKPEAGEPLFVTTKVDGKEVIKETYKYYAVNDSGRLIAEPKPEYENAPHIALLESRQITPMSVVNIHAMTVQTDNLEPINMAETRVFIEDLLAALRVHYPTLSMQDLVRQLGDFDQSLEAIRSEYMKSGLGSIQQFVDFYEAIDLGGENDEAEADQFLEQSGLNIAQFLDKLKVAGVSWDALLAAMKSQNIGFTGLFNSYASSLESLEVFIPKFVQGKKATVSMLLVTPQADPATDAAKVAVEAAKLGLDVAKFAWEIIKDARPKTTAEGAYTSVLSVKDKSYENYGYSIQGSSAVVDYEGKNLFTMTLFHAIFKVDGYYKATNPNIPGYWLPSIAFKVDESFAGLTWNLNAGAAITSAANMASASAPEPEIQVVANVQANGWFQSFTNSFTFYANGRTGFRKE